MQLPPVKVVLDETGLAEDYQIEGTFPMCGNNDRGVEQIAASVVGAVSKKNVLNRTIPTDAVEHPEKNPALTSSSRDTRCISSSPRADGNWT